MEGGSVRSPLAGHAGVSLMTDENSLFTQINSLFRRKFSLFGCVGNSVQEANDYAWLER
jgi:hypothetical protein